MRFDAKIDILYLYGAVRCGAQFGFEYNIIRCLG